MVNVHHQFVLIVLIQQHNALHVQQISICLTKLVYQYVQTDIMLTTQSVYFVQVHAKLVKVKQPFVYHV